MEYSGVEVSKSTVCKLLHNHGYLRKKMRQVALQRSAQLRGQFMAKAIMYSKVSYVYVTIVATCGNMVIQLNEKCRCDVDYWSGVKECLVLLQ